MTRTRYTIPTRSQDKLHAQRTMARLGDLDGVDDMEGGTI